MMENSSTPSKRKLESPQTDYYVSNPTQGNSSTPNKRKHESPPTDYYVANPTSVQSNTLSSGIPIIDRYPGQFNEPFNDSSSFMQTNDEIIDVLRDRRQLTSSYDYGNFREAARDASFREAAVQDRDRDPSMKETLDAFEKREHNPVTGVPVQGRFVTQPVAMRPEIIQPPHVAEITPGLTSSNGAGGVENWDRTFTVEGKDDSDMSMDNRLKRSGQSPLEKLTTNQYLFLLRQIESRLKGIRARIIQRDLQHLDLQLSQLRYQIDHFMEEFDLLKSNHYLRAGDFNNLLSLEEFLTTTLSPQLSLYELDHQQLTDPTSAQPNEVPVILSIVNQENAGPIFKEKTIGPFTLRLLTGATITQIQSGPVQPELVDTSQRVKRNNQELENIKQNFQENGTATFTDLKFSSGSFPNLVRLKFRVTIQILVNGQRITKTIESTPSKPFISMTNTGSQWKDAAGTWLKEDLFRDSYEVSMARLWNYFQKHYLVSTKQEISNIKRPLYMKDFEYLLHAKFQQGTKKQSINQKEFNWFWDWVGPGLKKIRYQKYLLWLFENGYLAGFVTGKEAEEELKKETPGTFMIRLSERLDGEFVISYVHGSGIRHYLIQPDDTADKKKTLIDFLGQNKIFVYIMQINTQPTGKRVFYKHNKDKILSKYYKKQSKQSSTTPQLDNNPYDTRLPFDLNSL